MIKSFADKLTEQVANGKFPKKLPVNLKTRAFMRLVQLDNAAVIDDLRLPPSNHLENLVVIERVNTAYELINNGGYVLSLKMAMLSM